MRGYRLLLWARLSFHGKENSLTLGLIDIFFFVALFSQALRKMEMFIHNENERIYHPARIHLRDPQKVGMIYVSFNHPLLSVPEFFFFFGQDPLT